MQHTTQRKGLWLNDMTIFRYIIPSSGSLEMVFELRDYFICVTVISRNPVRTGSNIKHYIT